METRKPNQLPSDSSASCTDSNENSDSQSARPKKMERGSDREIELKILRESLPNSKTLGDSLDSVADCTELGQVAIGELENAKKAIRFLNDIRDVKKAQNSDLSKPVADEIASENASENASEKKVLDRKLQDVDAPMPSLIGRFEVIRELGQGGFAKVFLCRDPDINRLVAVKIPKPHALISPESQRRFQREAHAAGTLSHPAIVPVFENDTSGPISFIVSAYCAGPTLAEWIEDHQDQITCRQAAQIISHLAEAVEHAHQRSVVHRDLKPGNILVESDFSENPLRLFGASAESPIDISYRVRITDFGLAKYTDDQQLASLTADGAVVGTPAYMSPEQARGSKTVGPQADLFALGAILYQLLTGTIPFKRNSNVATLRAIEDDIPLPPRRLNPAINKDLEAICLKCLEKDTSRRYATAHALHRDLCLWLEGRPVVARRPSRVDRVHAWYKRNPGLAAALAFAFLSLILGLTVSLWQRNQAQSNLLASNRQKERAERNVATLESTIDEVLDDYGELLDSGQSLDEWQFKTLSKFLIAHKILIEQEADHLDVTSTTLSAYYRLADIHYKTGKHAEAIAICRQAKQLSGVAGENKQQRLKPWLVDILDQEAVIIKSLNKFQMSKELLTKAISLLEECKSTIDVEAYESRLGRLHRHMGLVFIDQYKCDDANPHLRMALEIAVNRLRRNPNSKLQQLEHLLALQDLGENAQRIGNYPESARLFESALEQFDNINDVSDFKSQFRKACLLSDLAFANMHQNGNDLAELRFQQSIEIFNQLVSRDPTYALVFDQLIQTLKRQGEFYKNQYDFDAAKTIFMRGIELSDNVSTDRRRVQAKIFFADQCGRILSQHFEQADAASQQFSDVIDLGEKAVVQFPDDFEIRKSMMETYQELGRLEARVGNWDASLSNSQKASEHANAMLYFEPDQSRTQDLAVDASRSTSELAVQMGEIELAVRVLTEMSRLAPNSADIQYQTGRYLAAIPQLLSENEMVSETKLDAISQMANERAIEYVKRAVSLGFKKMSLFQNHPQWSELRETSEFQSLITQNFE